jgi:outer membrane protein OmpA-like peptidoglycan-associated protein
VPQSLPTDEGDRRSMICHCCEDALADFVSPYVNHEFGVCKPCNSKSSGIISHASPTNQITFNKQILFYAGSSSILASSQVTVKLLSKCLYDNLLPMQVEGHTSTDPSSDAVMWTFTDCRGNVREGTSKLLTELRAEAVCEKVIENLNIENSSGTSLDDLLLMNSTASYEEDKKKTKKKQGDGGNVFEEEMECFDVFLFPVGVGGQRHLDHLKDGSHSKNRRVEIHFINLI